MNCSHQRQRTYFIILVKLYTLQSKLTSNEHIQCHRSNSYLPAYLQKCNLKKKKLLSYMLKKKFYYQNIK